MRQFKYTAVDLQKKKFTGIFIAEDEKDLAVQLAKQNLFLVSASPYTGNTPSAFFTLGTGKVSHAELTTFCRQFAIMLNSGITLLDSLDVLKIQSYTSFFRSLLEMIAEDVRSGMMLSDALNKHKKVFPDFFRSMIRVGELSGNLELVLTSLADYYERDAALRRKTRGALAYPIMLFIMTIGIVLLMMLFVIPTFRENMASLDVPIEGLTKTVYDMSDFVLENWYLMLLFLMIVIGVIFLINRTPSGHFFFDKMKIKLPFIGRIKRDMIAARFARAFSVLIASGMDVVDAMENVSIILGNKYVEAKFKEATDKVRRGVNLTAAMEDCGFFPPILIQMVAIGERTNSLETVLARSCGFFDTQVETSLNSVTSKIQPAMLLFMGVIVVIMFIAIYSPMLSIMTNLSAPTAY